MAKVKLSIIGGGLSGCTLAYLLKDRYDITIYERKELGGICVDSKDYQKYIHIFHTDNDKIWEFLNEHTTVKPHKTIVKSFWDDGLHPHPPYDLTDEVIEKQFLPYSRKMWGGNAPPEAQKRWVVSDDGFLHHDKYEGIPDFTKLFKNLTEGIEIVYEDIRAEDVTGKAILTGPIDEYYDYTHGELPYRGMGSVHFPSDARLDADVITFPDERIPFLRLIDYARFGYGNYIGIEFPSNDKLYPVRNDETTAVYNKYVAMAREDGLELCGRAATFHYIDMDDCVAQAMELADRL